uniref:Superoxide Dismutase Cu-Zn n=1 Tax=Florenciella sp. virus SA2 TaxID=3240092 RepID=A0AB39JAJ0_9VIRU
MTNCCNHRKTSKFCKRIDGKVFKLPRKFTKDKCKRPRGFTMKSSCSPYKFCKKAVAVLAPNKDNITGEIYFTPSIGGIKIKYNINGLKNGKHGFHIHEYGDLTDGCNSACSHFNPDNKKHGGLNSSERHAGDLGNIETKQNKTRGTLFCKDLSLQPENKYNIIGRMIIIHEDEDDLGKGGNEESLKTGNAGKRIACGVIGIMKY